MNFGQTILNINFAGLAIGAIAAFYMGMVLSRLCASGDITRPIYQGFRYSLKMCVLGTAVGWSTLLIYISYMANNGLSYLMDPSLWAVLTVLVVITTILYFLRKVVIPMAKRRIGVSIFGGLTDSQQNKLISLGAASSVAWVMVLILLTIGERGADGFWFNYILYVSVFVGALIVCLFAGKFVGSVIRRKFRQRLKAKQVYYQNLVGAGPAGRYN